MRLLIIPLVAVTLRKTHHIQPVPPPTFTVLRHGQEAIHQFRERLRIWIINKGLNLCKTRGKPEQGVVGTADEDSPRSRRISDELLILEICLDDLIEVLLLLLPRERGVGGLEE